MKIRLLEIEFGTDDVQKSTAFYKQILGVEATVSQHALSVFNLKANQIDFNVSKHFSPKEMCTTFLTDNLEEMMVKLKAQNVLFNGPKPTHLGMISIDFKDPDGHLIKVNQATHTSPSWLKLATDR